MNIQRIDIQRLQMGEPPVSDEIIEKMTCGRELWIDIIKKQYLEKYIFSGGSKVKFIYGDLGAGKTHSLRAISIDAKKLGYETLYFDLSDNPVKLSNVMSFYKMLAENIHVPTIINLLSKKVVALLGYKDEDFVSYPCFLEYIKEKEGLPIGSAESIIRTAISNAFRDIDIAMSFKQFIFSTVYSKLTGNYINELFIKWLKGDKLYASEKKEINIYETLKKVNAINWLYSLIKLINLSGLPGFLIIFDNLHILRKKDEFGHFYYTPKAVNDFFELIREIIDRTEILKNFFMIFSSERRMLYDDKRGFKSYEALWMRIQSGIISNEFFNPFNDLIDMDAHFETLEEKNFLDEITEKLEAILKQNKTSSDNKEIFLDDEIHPLKRKIMEKTIMISMEQFDGTDKSPCNY